MLALTKHRWSMSSSHFRDGDTVRPRYLYVESCSICSFSINTGGKVHDIFETEA